MDQVNIRQWRQGDVLFEPHAGALSGEPRAGAVLYQGEATGHAHRVSGEGVEVRETSWSLFLDAPAGALVEHEEHGPITLPPGRYRVWRQREYTEQGFRDVHD